MKPAERIAEVTATASRALPCGHRPSDLDPSGWCLACDQARSDAVLARKRSATRADHLAGVGNVIPRAPVDPAGESSPPAGVMRLREGLRARQAKANGSASPASPAIEKQEPARAVSDSDRSAVRARPQVSETDSTAPERPWSELSDEEKRELRRGWGRAGAKAQQARAESSEVLWSAVAARRWLLDLLAGGPMVRTKIVDAARAAGIRDGMLRKAKLGAGVVSVRIGAMGEPAWSLDGRNNSRNSSDTDAARCPSSRRPLIEVRPDGSIVTDDPETAVLIARRMRGEP